MKLAAYCFAFALVFNLLLAAGAQAQSLPEAEQKVYDKFLEAQEMNDARALTKLAQKYKNEVKTIYDYLEADLSYNDSIDAWEELKVFGNSLDGLDGSNVYAIRLKLVMGLTLEQRQARDNARNKYGQLYNELRSAKTAQNNQAISDTLKAFEELAAEFAKLGDAEYQAYSLSEVATTLKDSEQQLEAVKMYDAIDSSLTRAGYRQFSFHGQVIQIRDQLKNQGFDPNAKVGEGGGATANTGTSWSDDPLGQRWSDPVPLRYMESAKLPTQYATPSMQTGADTARWRMTPLSGPGPAPFSGTFKPLGRTFEVSRQGVKLFLHSQDLKKPLEFKCISKPNLVKMSRQEEDWNGKPIKLKYAWLSCTGAEEESRFGLSLNGSPQADWIPIRFHPACYLKGKVLGQDLMVFDDNATGMFGDAIAVEDDTTAVRPKYRYPDAMIVGRSKIAGPFSEYLLADGAFYRIKVSPKDYSLSSRKLAIDSGSVTLKFEGKIAPQFVVIEETRELKGAFFAIGKKPIVVPVGYYRISYGIIRKGKKASEKSCLILPSEKFSSFRVTKDEEYVLELGAPLTFDFVAEDLGDGAHKIAGNTVVVYGKAGEMYTHFWDDPPIPEKVSVRDEASGSSAARTQSMKKATVDDWRQNSHSIFQPLDMLFDLNPSKNYQFRMELKKHPLLGGPIKSEWK